MESNMADEEEENRETNSVSKDKINEQEKASCDRTSLKNEEASMTTLSNLEDRKQALTADEERFFKVPSVKKDTNLPETTNDEKKENAPELRYKVPWWSAIPSQMDDFSLEILKNGCIISTVDLNDKAYHVVGRLPLCDVVMEHPSISRYHAVIQYRGETDGDKTLSGFYLYDLGSTHGTLVNKNNIKPKTYYRLKVGYVIKFGGSSRLFVLQGPADDDQEEIKAQAIHPTSENTATVKAGQIFTDEEYESLKKVEKKGEESEGINWGFGEDAEEEHIDSEKFEELYSGVEFKDPKKTLRGYYEREGLELEYQVDETGPGHARVYHCRVRLPIDGPNGSAVYAEASVTGRKKEAVRECANEACKMLDAYGLLRQSNHESRKKRERNWEQDDFYESDEDNFLDRTGTVETKRLKRMRKAGKDKPEIETYDSLLLKLAKVQEETKSLEKQLRDASAFDASTDEDSLDDYMNTMSKRLDKATKLKMKRKIIDLKKEEEKLTKLVSVAKPASLPSFGSVSRAEESAVKTDTTKQNIGKSDLLRKEERGNNEIGRELNVARNEDKQNANGLIPETEKQKPVLAAQAKPVSKPFTDFAVPTCNVRATKSKERLNGTDKKDDANVAAQDRSKSQPKTKRNNEPVEKKENAEKTSEQMTMKKDLQVSQKKRLYTARTQWEDANDPDFASWIPPQGQSGDGRTKLNDKYGY